MGSNTVDKAPSEGLVVGESLCLAITPYRTHDPSVTVSKTLTSAREQVHAEEETKPVTNKHEHCHQDEVSPSPEIIMGETVSDQRRRLTNMTNKNLQIEIHKFHTEVYKMKYFFQEAGASAVMMQEKLNWLRRSVSASKESFDKMVEVEGELGVDEEDATV